MKRMKRVAIARDFETEDFGAFLERVEIVLSAELRDAEHQDEDYGGLGRVVAYIEYGP